MVSSPIPFNQAEAGPSRQEALRPLLHPTDNHDTPQSSKARAHGGLKRAVSHRSPHGHSGSGAGLWLANTSDRGNSPDGDDGAIEANRTTSRPSSGQKLYYFPATLAGGPSRGGGADQPSIQASRMMTSVLGLDGLDSPVGSTESEVDLDLSFDYVSRLESDSDSSPRSRQKARAMAEVGAASTTHAENKGISSSPTKPSAPMVEGTDRPRKSLPSTPANLQIRGMASADWEKRRKAPPAPLALRGRATSNASAFPPSMDAMRRGGLRTVGPAPHTTQPTNGSFFSPITPNVPALDGEEPLPLTPLSASRRASKLLPSASYFTGQRIQSDGEMHTSNVIESEEGRSSPSSSGLATKRSNSSSGASTAHPDRVLRSGSSRSMRRSRSNTASTAGSLRPPRLPPPTGPLPTSPAEVDNGSQRFDRIQAARMPPRRSEESSRGQVWPSPSNESNHPGHLVDVALRPSMTNLTLRSSSIASFQTAESSDLEAPTRQASVVINGNESDGVVIDTVTVVKVDECRPEPGPCQPSTALASTPMLLSASEATVKSGSSSEKSSLSPTSHCSPMTPFTPLFMDPGSGKVVQLTSPPNEWNGENYFGRPSTLGAEAVRMSRMDGLPTIYAGDVHLHGWQPTVNPEELRTSPEKRKERRQTEQWILAQRQRRAELQQQEMGAIVTATTNEVEAKEVLESAQLDMPPSVSRHDRVSTSGSSEDDRRPKQILVISTASSPSETMFGQATFPFPAILAGADTQRGGELLVGPVGAGRQATSSGAEVPSSHPPLTRNRSGTKGPWPQSPLLLSPDAMAMASLSPPSPAGTTIIHQLDEDEEIDPRSLCDDRVAVEKMLFEPALHESTRAPSSPSMEEASSLPYREIKSASALQTSFGSQANKPWPESDHQSLGLGLGLDLDPNDPSAKQIQKALSEQNLRTAYTSRRPSMVGPALDDDTGSPCLAIDMTPDPTLQPDSRDAKLQHSMLHLGGVSTQPFPSVYQRTGGGALGLDLGLGILEGASPLLPDNCRSPRTASGKQHGSNTAGGLDTILGTGEGRAPSTSLTRNLVVHRAVTDLRPTTEKTLRESSSFASNISAFVYNPTPPTPTFRDALEYPSDFVDLDLGDGESKAAAYASSFQREAQQDAAAKGGGWRTKLLGAVASSPRQSMLGRSQSIRSGEEGSTKRPPFRTLTLLRRRPSEVKSGGTDHSSNGREKAAGDAQRVTERMMVQGPFSAPPTAALPNEDATFPSRSGESPALRSLDLNGEERLEGARPLLILADSGATCGLQRANSASTKATRRMSAAERKQKRNSGIAYIKDDGEVVLPWTADAAAVVEPAPVVSAPKPVHSRRISLTFFGGKERAQAPATAVDQAAAGNPLDGLKSPRVAPSPSGFTPRMRFDPGDWGVDADAQQQEQRQPEDPICNLVKPEQAASRALAASHTGLTLEEMERSRANLQRFASTQTDSRAGSRIGASTPSSFSSLYRPGGASVKVVQPPDASAGLHRRTRTARFANELMPGMDEDGGTGEYQDPITAAAARRSGSSQAVASPASRVHTFGKVPTRFSPDVSRQSPTARRHSMLVSPLPSFTAPSRYLESATPSKSMFWAGFLGMPWLWLIGGWWLDAEGHVVSRQPRNRVEFWQHEPSMATSSVGSPSLRPVGFDAPSPDTINPLSRRSTGEYTRRYDGPRPLRSQNTFTSLHSHYSNVAPSVISSAGTSATANVTNADPSRIPRSRTRSIASLIDRQPEVALYQSPVRVVESPSGGGMMASGTTRSFSRANTPLAQLAEMEETTQETEEYERLRDEMVAKADAAREEMRRMPGGVPDSARPSTEIGEALGGGRGSAMSTVDTDKADSSRSPSSRGQFSHSLHANGAAMQQEDDAFTHPFIRPLRRQWTADSMVSQHALLASKRSMLQRGGPLGMFHGWGSLERYVLYNRIAAMVGSLLVLAGWSGAIWAVVANF